MEGSRDYRSKSANLCVAANEDDFHFIGESGYQCDFSMYVITIPR